MTCWPHRGCTYEQLNEWGKTDDLLAAQGVYSRLYNAQKQLEDLGEVSA